MVKPTSAAVAGWMGSKVLLPAAGTLLATMTIWLVIQDSVPSGGSGEGLVLTELDTGSAGDFEVVKGGVVVATGRSEKESNGVVPEASSSSLHVHVWLTGESDPIDLPAVGVYIRKLDSKALGLSMTTDENGTASFEDLVDGRYGVSDRRFGGWEKSLAHATFTVGAGAEPRVEIRLTEPR